MASGVHISRKGAERSRVLDGGAGGQPPESAVAGVDLAFLTDGVRVYAPSVEGDAVDVAVFEHDFEGSGRNCWDLDVSVFVHSFDWKVCKMAWEYVRGGVVVEGVDEVEVGGISGLGRDAMGKTVSVGNWFMAKMELLSAQPVLAPWVVNAAVVVPQSHRSVTLPWTDEDGKNVKQFSVLV